ncbi:hypothetical protein [Pseudomonas lundensis]|uniref:hypothetical protein n=1 Tax=Pseudomonas lundensis TaxID=86185 RepID=UPI001890EAE9|nr:hypothetical protein [Pseudomonas lundensis]QOF91289.1 hypothetical protein IF654_20750 [Pseudomonas lundensis]
MEFLKGLLADPVVSAVGYILTVVSGVIAIVQVSGKAKAEREIVELRSVISNVTNEKNKLKLDIESMNVTQGEKSQFFQSNSGAVNIDNRG